jgi:carbamoyl-phosphate synthase large subunit
MKSVGEAMAIGRTFKEAFQKGLRALEIDRPGWVTAARLEDDRLETGDVEDLRAALGRPTPERVFQINGPSSLAHGGGVAQRTGIDRVPGRRASWSSGRPVPGLPIRTRCCGRRSGWALGPPARGLARRPKRLCTNGVGPCGSTGVHTVTRAGGSIEHALPVIVVRRGERVSLQPGIVILGSGELDRSGVEFDYCCVGLGSGGLGFRTTRQLQRPSPDPTLDKLFAAPRGRGDPPARATEGHHLQLGARPLAREGPRRLGRTSGDQFGCDRHG